MWLNEGLACYLSGKNISHENISKKELLGVFKYFDAVDREAYLIGQFWVEKLFKKYGGTKMIALIKNLSPELTERDFSKTFKKVYKINYDKKSFERLLTM